MPSHFRELLIVDGYNVIHKSSRYTDLMDDANAGDPLERSREQLIADVAAYAQGRYDATIVFDAAGNVSPDRPNLPKAGIHIVFSQAGESADTVIERLVTSARRTSQDVTVVTSDNTIRATVGGVPVTCVSSDVLVTDVYQLASEMETERTEHAHQHLTLEDRLDSATRARLDKMLGRS